MFRPYPYPSRTLPYISLIVLIAVISMIAAVGWTMYIYQPMREIYSITATAGAIENNYRSAQMAATATKLTLTQVNDHFRKSESITTYSTLALLVVITSALVVVILSAVFIWSLRNKSTSRVALLESQTVLLKTIPAKPNNLPEESYLSEKRTQSGN